MELFLDVSLLHQSSAIEEHPSPVLHCITAVVVGGRAACGATPHPTLSCVTLSKCDALISGDLRARCAQRPSESEEDSTGSFRARDEVQAGSCGGGDAAE